MPLSNPSHTGVAWPQTPLDAFCICSLTSTWGNPKGKNLYMEFGSFLGLLHIQLLTEAKAFPRASPVCELPPVFPLWTVKKKATQYWCGADGENTRQYLREQNGGKRKRAIKKENWELPLPCCSQRGLHSGESASSQLQAKLICKDAKGRGFLQECWKANFPNLQSTAEPQSITESVYIELYFSRHMDFQNLGKGEAITSSVLICSNPFWAGPWIILYFRDLGKSLSQSYYDQELKHKSKHFFPLGATNIWHLKYNVSLW